MPPTPGQPTPIPLGGIKLVGGSAELSPELVQSLRGAPGPAGPTGPQGPAGPPGVQGPAGPAGDRGLTGPAGPTGSPGPQGQAGAAGPAGTMGLQGPRGDTGLTGPAGPKGDTGSEGPRGKGVQSGTAAPDPAKGLPGDFYIQLKPDGNRLMFGPRSTGVAPNVWGTPVSWR